MPTKQQRETTQRRKTEFAKLKARVEDLELFAVDTMQALNQAQNQAILVHCRTQALMELWIEGMPPSKSLFDKRANQILQQIRKEMGITEEATEGAVPETESKPSQPTTAGVVESAHQVSG